MEKFYFRNCFTATHNSTTFPFNLGFIGLDNNLYSKYVPQVSGWSNIKP